MSQNLSRLCSLLIEDTYGPLYSHIFNVLLAYGSLSTNAIVQKCHLPTRKIREGLAILVQNLLVFHHTTPDERTSYQPNTAAAYDLIRVGRYTQSIRYRFGHDGVRIILHLLKYGHSTMSDLQQVLDKSSSYTIDRSTVGLDGMLQSQFSRVLLRMVAEEYLTDLQAVHFQTWDHTRKDVELAVKESGTLSNAKGKKGQDELEICIMDELRKRYGGDRSNQALIQHAKRPAEVLEVPNTKKRRLTNGTSAESNADPQSIVDRSGISSSSQTQSCITDNRKNITTLRLNCNKINAMLRHERLARQVTERMGRRSGQVLASILYQCDSRPQKLLGLSQSMIDGRAAEDSIWEIDMNRVLLDVNVRDYAHDDEADTERIRSSKSNVFAGYSTQTNGYVNGDSRRNSNDCFSLDEVEEEISTLAEALAGLIFQDSVTRRWKINLEVSSLRLLDEEIVVLVKRRFGSTALRIIRILIERGKLDEKSLQEIGLLNAKDLRRSLAQLSSHGFVDLQEVPREPQRQPTRTIYLWFYDSERVRQRVLEDLYKTMVKMMQRLKLERRRVSSTLDKVERSDVKGSEHKYLGHAEMEVLKRWRRKELWFLSELDRLADSVAMLSEN